MKHKITIKKRSTGSLLEFTPAYLPRKNKFSGPAPSFKIPLIIALIFLVLFTGIYFLSPGITGWFIAEQGLIAYERNVTWEINANKELPFTITEHPQDFDLRTLRLSGSYIGDGTVNATLKHKMEQDS